MAMRHPRLAKICFHAVAGIYLLIGMIYLLRSTPLPYHLEYLGKDVSELEPRMIGLMLLAKDAVGGLLLSIGITTLLLARQLRAELPWVRWVLALGLVPSILVFLHITLTVGIHSPWWAVVIAMTLVVWGAFSAGEDRKGAMTSVPPEPGAHQ